MNTTIKSYFTRGLCSTCYRELSAQIEYRTDGSAYICKTCVEHGYEEFMIEKSWEFWEKIIQKNPNNITKQIYDQIYVIEVTDRCNLLCKHCYHLPNNNIIDKPKDFIISKIKSSPLPIVSLMGAEPTMRDDLFEIISESKNEMFPKRINIYTNGLKLAENNYVKKLEESKLDTLSISIHHPKYHKDRIWELVTCGIDNIAQSKISLSQISFTVESLDEVRYVVEKILWFKENNRLPFNFCIRSGAEIGTKLDKNEVFASEIVNWLEIVSNEKNISFERHPNGGSNPYHILYTLDDNLSIQVIHWAGVKNVDLQWMNMGPYSEFIPMTFSTFHLQIILREGWKKGWWQGQRILSNHL